MSLLHRQIQYLIRHPGYPRLPRRVEATSPLLELLDRIPGAMLAQLRGVRLSPALGYRSAAIFQTGAQLHAWLRPFPVMLDTDSWPAESARDKAFRGPIPLETFLEHCANGAEIGARFATLLCRSLGTTHYSTLPTQERAS